MKHWLLILIISMIIAPLPGIGYAQEPGQVVLKSTIHREIEVVNEDGEKEIQLVEAGNAIPGDELIFTVTYTNQGTEPAENVVLVNPVPEHTEYIGGSAGDGDATITFSVDDGSSYDLPENLTVTGEDGRPRTAQAQEYTHIRWVRTGPLSSGEGGKVVFRVRLK
jgi:uncharacterized repeat protein (TIGR01451 family)